MVDMAFLLCQGFSGRSWKDVVRDSYCSIRFPRKLESSASHIWEADLEEKLCFSDGR